MSANTFEQGFNKFKSVYNQPKEYSTSIHVEGFEPVKVHGFKLEKKDDKGLIVEVTEDDLRELYRRTLTGDEGIAI